MWEKWKICNLFPNRHLPACSTVKSVYKSAWEANFNYRWRWHPLVEDCIRLIQHQSHTNQWGMSGCYVHWNSLTESISMYILLIWLKKNSLQAIQFFNLAYRGRTWNNNELEWCATSQQEAVNVLRLDAWLEFHGYSHQSDIAPAHTTAVVVPIDGIHLTTCN